jgi:hypothetical protein
MLVGAWGAGLLMDWTPSEAVPPAPRASAPAE